MLFYHILTYNLGNNANTELIERRGSEMGLFDSIKNDAKQRLSDERNDRRSSYEKASNRELRNEANHGSSIASRSRAQSELNRRQGR